MTEPLDLNPPVVGEGATIRTWTDRQAYTVERVSDDGKVAWLRADRATLLNGLSSDQPDALTWVRGGFSGHVSGTQRYSYEPNPGGALVEVSRRILRGGRVTWKPRSADTTGPGNEVRFGVRDQYHDFNF